MRGGRGGKVKTAPAPRRCSIPANYAALYILWTLHRTNREKQIYEGVREGKQTPDI